MLHSSRRHPAPSLPLRPIVAAICTALLGIAVATVSLSPVTSFAAESNTASGKRPFAIPAGPLSQSLYSFASSAGITLSFDPALTDGLRSSGLNGNYAVADGLAALLAGSGLEAVPGANGGYLLRKPADAAEAVLPSVTVSTGVSTTTEGTGQYTGSQTSTASRMPLTVKETPQSVTIVTRQRLDDFQIQTAQAALANVVGITDQRTESDRGTYTARGFTITNMQVDGIAVPYAGSVPSGRSSSLNFDSYLYDRIEVVRGATGLLSPTGDPSATINLVRKKPGKEFAASGFLTAGNRSLYRGGIDLTTPLTEDGRVRARLIGVHHQTDSWRDHASERREILSGLLEFDLTPTTLLRLSHTFQDSKSRGATYGSLPRYYSDGGRLDMPRSANLSAGWSRWDKSNNLTEATLEQQLDDRWNLVASVGYTRATNDPSLAYMGNGVPDRLGNGRSFWTYDSDGTKTQWTYDVHVNGRFDLFGREHMAMFGINGYRARDARASGGTVALTETYNIFGFNGITSSLQRIGPRDAFTTDRENMSGYFGSVRLSLTDPLHVIVGGRMTDWRFSTRTRNTTTGSTGFTETRPDKVFTPFAGVTYDINPSLTAYASYADMFTPQSLRDVNNNIIDPIVGSNKEIGLKSTLLDERLMINVALFEAERDNVAELVIPEVLLPDGSNAYSSTGKGNKTRGYEIEVSGAITDRLNLYAGYGRNKTKTPEGEITNTSVPQETFKLQTTWRPPVLQERLTVGGSVSWQSTAWGDVALANVGTIRVEQKAYSLVGLMARYDASDRLSVSVNVNNLFDKAYYVGATSGYYGEPRSILATVNMKF